MHVDGKRSIEAATSTSTSNSVFHLADEYEKQFRSEVDDLDLSRVASSESQCADGDDESVLGATSSFRSVDAISTLETREAWDVGRHDAPSSESNIRSLVYSTLYKHKNRYSLSVDDRACFENLSNTRGSVLEDEPQEGKAKRSILLSCREYLANYQESRGTPRTEYSYAALIIVMARATAQSLWALIYIFVNVAPVIQMLSFILRFVLDKVISIRRTKNVHQMIMKSAILAVQLLSVYICLVFILGVTVLPIAQVALGIATKFAMRD